MNTKKIYGIITEYNPLHEGHKYQLSFVKNELKAYGIVVVMSGAFTQRGIPAVTDKYERAKDALLAGADMVVEHPVTGSTQSAEGFSKSGISLLNDLGVVTHVAFGMEDSEVSELSDITDALLNESEEYKQRLFKNLKSGFNFAKARDLAFNETYPKKAPKGFFEKPNNILGIEYVKALKDLDSKIIPIPIKRNPEFESSSAIREKLKKTGDKNLVFTDDFSPFLHREILINNGFSDIADSTKELCARLINTRNDYTSYLKFADSLKTKNITHSHVMRFLCHILLGMKNNTRYKNYAHILGIKKESEWLLSAIKKQASIPVFTSKKEASEILSESPETLSSYKINEYADTLYRTVLTLKTGISYPADESRKFLIV